MAEAALPYEQLLNALDASFEIWRDIVTTFVAQSTAVNATADTALRSALLRRSLQKLDEIHNDRASAAINEFYEGSRLICDLLRVCARQAEGLDAVFSSSTAMQPLLRCCLWIPNGQESDVKSTELPVDDDSIERAFAMNSMAFRCLTNILFNSSTAMDAFCQSLDAISSLIDLLATKNSGLPIELQFQCTKLLFLLCGLR